MAVSCQALCYTLQKNKIIGNFPTKNLDILTWLFTLYLCQIKTKSFLHSWLRYKSVFIFEKPNISLKVNNKSGSGPTLSWSKRVIKCKVNLQINIYKMFCTWFSF